MLLPFLGRQNEGVSNRKADMFWCTSDPNIRNGKNKETLFTDCRISYGINFFHVPGSKSVRAVKASTTVGIIEADTDLNSEKQAGYIRALIRAIRVRRYATTAPATCSGWTGTLPRSAVRTASGTGSITRACSTTSGATTTAGPSRT